MEPLVLVECPTIGELDHLWVWISFDETTSQVLIVVCHFIAVVVYIIFASSQTIPEEDVEPISSVDSRPTTKELIFVLWSYLPICLFWSLVGVSVTSSKVKQALVDGPNMLKVVSAITFICVVAEEFPLLSTQFLDLLVGLGSSG